MGDQSQPLGPFDPTEEEIDRARRTLARVDRADRSATAFAQIAGRLDGIPIPHTDITQSIREMRAVLAAYDELRREVES